MHWLKSLLSSLRQPHFLSARIRHGCESNHVADSCAEVAFDTCSTPKYLYTTSWQQWTHRRLRWQCRRTTGKFRHTQTLAFAWMLTTTLCRRRDRISVHAWWANDCMAAVPESYSIPASRGYRLPSQTAVLMFRRPAMCLSLPCSAVNVDATCH